MSRLFRQLRMRHESKHAKAVVNSHDDDAFRCHTLAVVARLRSIPPHKAAAVKINEHRQSLARGFRRSPNIQIETIFTHTVRTEDHVVEYSSLHTAGTKFDCLPHALPVLDSLRFAPTQITRGRLREWNTSEDANARRLHTASFKSAVSRLDQVSGGFGDSVNKNYEPKKKIFNCHIDHFIRDHGTYCRGGPRCPP